MWPVRFILLSLQLFGIARGAVLVWSNRDLSLTPLQEFGDSEYQELLEKLNDPEAFIFKTTKLDSGIRDVFKGFFRAYNPNGFINTEGAIELEGTNEDKEIIQEKVNEIADKTKPVLFVIVISNEEHLRYTREAPQNENDTEVFYVGSLIKDETSYGILYSTRNLQLTINGSKIFLGETKPDMVSVDTTPDGFSRLSIKIPTDFGRISLRLMFSQSGTYWSLDMVKVEATIRSNNNLVSFNLTTKSDVTFPMRFSYHCAGVTSFVSDEATLDIEDMQVQIGAPRDRFSDSWDCVPFVTAPIWSGLFVSAVLIFVLFFGFASIGDIKTMDKFDTYKTKQLHITLSE